MSRQRVLALMALHMLWHDVQIGLYETGSEAITPNSKSLTLQELLEALALTYSQIVDALQEMPIEQLASLISQNDSETPLGQLLAGLHWHETYHVGQLEILRQLASKNDAVV